MPAKSPTNVSCKTLSSTSIGCDWREIPSLDINGNLLGYRIKFRPYDAGNRLALWNSSNFPANCYSGIIKNLKKFSRYEVMVHGYTSGGEGPGIWMQLMTDEDGKYLKNQIFTFLILREIFKINTSVETKQ